MCVMPNGKAIREKIDHSPPSSRVSPALTTAAVVPVSQMTSAVKMSLGAKLLTTALKVSNNCLLDFIPFVHANQTPPHHQSVSPFQACSA